MIADMRSNNKLNPMATELFIRGRKLNISLFFLHNLVLLWQKNIRLNSTHYFTMKISNKWEVQQFAVNHSSDTDFSDFMNIYKKCTEKSYSLLVIDATLAWDNPLRFRTNLVERIQKSIITIDDKITQRLLR